MATSANSKKRDDIAKTNSLPPGFIAEYEGEHAPVKVVFLLLDMEQEAQREARICRRQSFFDPRRAHRTRQRAEPDWDDQADDWLSVGARFSVRAQ